MDRRALLGLLAASPLGLLLPRSVRAEWDPGSQYRSFKELWHEMLEEASLSANSTVVACDNPKELLMGWVVFSTNDQGEETGHLWEVSTRQIKRLYAAASEAEKAFMHRHVRRPMARLRFAQMTQATGRVRYSMREGTSKLV